MYEKYVANKNCHSDHYMKQQITRTVWHSEKVKPICDVMQATLSEDVYMVGTPQIQCCLDSVACSWQ